MVTGDLGKPQEPQPGLEEQEDPGCILRAE
jgi:hypothetical protein